MYYLKERIDKVSKCNFRSEVFSLFRLFIFERNLRNKEICFRGNKHLRKLGGASVSINPF